jgi:hypothetical protein
MDNGASLAGRRTDGASAPFGKALSKDFAPAQDGVAAEAAGNHQELYDPLRAWPYQTTLLEMADHGTRLDPRNDDQSLTLLIKVSA